MIDPLTLCVCSFAYLAASLVVAALFVRIAPGSRLSRRIRRRSWLIPAAPVLIPGWIVARAIRPIPGVAGRLLRSSFHRLSGKRLYRRVPQGPYSGYADYRHRGG